MICMPDLSRRIRTVEFVLNRM